MKQRTVAAPLGVLMMLGCILSATINPEPPSSHIAAAGIGLLGLVLLFASCLKQSEKPFKPYPHVLAWVAAGFGALWLALAIANMVLNFAQVSSWMPLLLVAAGLLVMGIWSLRRRVHH
ncbi:hypothetical protein [Pseudoclavibacter helvolus]|uniref:hypothetical protein n=1 Tax=Pseudoclavibacter helvolus TaxID=255205 RepID=UPI003C79346F